MNHTLIMLLGFAVCVALCGCEIVPIGTTAKLKALQKSHRSSRHSTHHRRAASRRYDVCQSGWLSEYHEMEAEHGGYAIADDQKFSTKAIRSKCHERY